MVIRVEGRQLLTPAEVAQIFHVDPKTVNRWAKQGKLTDITWTPGGHRRYSLEEIEKLLGHELEVWRDPR